MLDAGRINIPCKHRTANNFLLTDESLLLIIRHQKLKSQNAVMHQAGICNLSQKNWAHIQREQNARIEEVYGDVERYVVSKRSGDMFNAIRNLNGKQISHNSHIKDANAAILNDTERVCKTLAEYSEQLFAEQHINM